MNAERKGTVEEVRLYVKEKEGIDYSVQVIQNWINPSHEGRLENPQGYAEVARSCGDGMIFFLRIDQDQVMRARFSSTGCIPVMASGNMTAMMAEGKDVYDAFDIDALTIAHALGGLPEGEEHCAEMACEALHQALRDYLQYKNEPWKKGYHKKY